MTAAVAATLLLAACGGDGNPSLSIGDGNVDDGPIEGNVAYVEVDVNGVDITAPDGDTSGATGHLHVFVDREPTPVGEVIPKERGIIHTTAPFIEVFGLERGDHQATVVLGDGQHRRIHPDAIVTAAFEVAGPTVQISAPETADADQPVTLQVDVTGADITAPDGDTSGQTGHLHAFIDRNPQQMLDLGDTIPNDDGIIHTTDTTIEIPDLEPGEHTIWVMLGDGNHALSWPSPVGDRVALTVQ